MDQPHRLAAVDGLRGIAILLVIYQHAYSVSVYRGYEQAFGHPPWLVGDGWLGVGLFFVLSGFVLTLPFVAGTRTLKTPADFASFYRRRALRLWPMLVLGAAAGFILALPAGEAKLRSLFLTITATSMLTRDQFFPEVFFVAWSLVVEVWASALLPFLILAARRFGWERTLLAVLALSLIVRLIGTQEVFINFHVRPIKDSVPGRIDDFMVGAWIAHRFATGSLPQFRAMGFVALAALVVAGVVSDLCLHRQLSQTAFALVNNFAQLGFGLALICALASKSWRTVLSFWPLQLFGAMSYSLYVWHGYFIGHPNGPMAVQPFSVWGNVTFWVPMLIVSAVTYRFVEFPTVEWRRLFRFRGDAIRSRRCS
jgi:peptidoglycan/LPS O-acetylase OafA/YrhL